MNLSVDELKILDNLKSDKNLTNKNLQIIACAGSGKTEFISMRIAFLIAEKITKSENILAFTFTDNAAEELKFRIRNKIRKIIGHQPDIGDMYVGTIHSFAFEILKDHVPKYKVYDVLDEGKCYAFISSIKNDLYYNELKEWLNLNYDKPYGYTEEAWVLNTLTNGFDLIREELVNPKKISLCEYFHLSFDKYLEKLNEKKFLDFSGMLSTCVNVLENKKEILNEVRKKYAYITIDEYQDINNIQERMIQLLVGENNNICVVGDDDQSIYQWRGACVENIITFKKRYKNSITHPLLINRRSTDKIIKSAELLINKNKNRLPKEMKHSGKISDKGDLYKINFDKTEDEINFIINKINSLIGTEYKDNEKTRGLAYSDIAIFFRSIRYNAQPFIEALRNNEIPYTVTGVGGLFDTEEIDIIFSIFSYLGDFGKDRVDKEYIVPDLKDIYENAEEIFFVGNKKDFVEFFKNFKNKLKNKSRITLQNIYSDILMYLGINNDNFHSKENEVILFNLGKFSQVLSDYEGTRTYCTYRDIERFCWFVTHYASSNYDSGDGDDSSRLIDAVQIFTLHGTKGLGFPIVFMPFCIHRDERDSFCGFINPKKFDFTRYNGSEEDERRLFYVGMTRAKKYLFITTSKDPGYKKRKKEPSIFFNEVNDKFFITKSDYPLPKKKKMTPEPCLEDYRFPTNYSELSDYIRCEYDYKMRYIYGFNPDIVQALGYGNHVHNILNQLHKIAQAKGIVPEPGIAAEYIKNDFYLRYAGETQQDRFKKSAMRSILKYITLWREDFSLSVKSERNFEIDFENALVNGTIDLLKRKSQLENNILEIIDFKTGNERKLSEELHLQVQLYTYIAREALNLTIEKAYVHFLDDEKQNRVEVLTTDTQLNMAMNTVKDAIYGITNQRFKRNPRQKKTCESCDWRKICPKKK